ncbi:MAG: tape measure protein [Acidaminococcus sp.]|uniref:tape measure protein n=1 Tax=Acidaminococcus sp. TaxID=1872103 RepID=UPI0026DEAC3C|nr:tape measure protein [Acidaminococcus sp.]MDO5598162.1 tape measure protein [Acidaminococcus sp.]
MSNNRIDITLEADASGAIRVIKQVSTSVDQLAGKKVGNAGMPELANGAQRASQSLKQTKADTDALASAIGKIKGMIAGAFTVGAITSLGKKALEASANMEVLRQGLDFVLGSSEETDKLINGMRALGEQSAYDTNELIPLARQWVNMGDNAETAVGKMTKIVDLGSAFGLTSEQIGSATLALSQMAAAGKINGQDMLQLTNANIPAWKLLADHMGLSVAELRKMSEAGQLGEDAINELWDAIEERTQGATSRMNGTLMASFSNLEEEIQNSMAGIGDIISQAFNLKGILQGGSDMVSSFREALEQIKQDAESVGIGQAIMNQISNVSPELATLLGTIGNIVGEFINIVIAGWNEIYATLSNLDIAAILMVINDVVSRAGPAVLAAVSLIIGAINLILPVVVGLINAFANAYNTVSPYITSMASLFQQIPVAVSTAITAISTAFSSFVSWLESSVWQPIRNAAVTVINFIVGSWVAFGGFVMAAVQPLVDWFQSSVWQPISEFATAAWNTITALWGQFVDWFSQVMSPVTDVASECWNAICDFASEAWDTISGIWSVVAGWFDSTVVQPVRSSFDNGTSFISQCFQTAYNTIVGIFGGLARWFESNVVQPIKEKFSKILSLGSSVTGMTVTASGSGDAPAAAQGGVFGRFASGGVVGGRIPALANGGQSNRGTMALIGEAGPETVLPLKKIILGKVGQAIAEASGMDANKKNPVYNTRKSFSDTTKPKDVDAYTKILDETKQKILKINEAQAKFHEEWQKAQEDASKYTEGGEKALAFQKQMASNQEKIAKLQEKISSGNGDAKDAEALKILQLQTQNRIAEYEKEKAAAIAAAQETQDAITNIDAEAEAARQKVKQQAIDQMGSYETQLAQAQYAQKKAMMATELDDFLAQMTAKDEITGQSYATTLANEQYLAEQRRVWMDELMLASVSWGEYMQTMLTNMAVQVQDGIASGIAQCVVEGKKFSQVMSNLAKTLLKQLIQGVIQKVISGWIMAIGLGNNRHKQEMKNTAAETEAAAAKATVMASVATAAVIAANPHMAAGAAALVSGQMGEAAAAAGLISKAAQKVFQDKDSDSGGDKDKKKDNLVINIGADPDSLTKAWNLPHFAKGGVVTGPTAALIGEGRYDEAVLPLKPSLLERLFGGGDDNRQNTVVATQNIYGNINSRDDEDDLFGGFNDMVLAGLRGA